MGTAGIRNIDDLPDHELERLNRLLPWAAFITDARGRRFGAPYSDVKRNTAQEIPDRRILELEKRYGLQGKQILEAGCFEGIHTVALCQLDASVLAFDGRIENVIKTIARCWAFGVAPDVFFWNLELPCPAGRSIDADILHHVGVLYHLSDPVQHLTDVLPHIRQAVMLDTHIAPPGSLATGRSGDFDYRYFNFKESGRNAPFAGLAGHAKWLHLDDLVRLLNAQGFATVDVAERRDERNGPRVLIFAHR